ncbi:MAG: hypothetical protein H0T76_09565 [Nannocystis sp.]|nr:hypothetical protein [Nannocystis sp.]MBA3546716.1 hypothetical protein [Nannocystis sp.]
MANELEKLLEKSRSVRMTKDDKEAQRRSFAFGNANIENERVTRAMVDAAAKGIASNDRK